MDEQGIERTLTDCERALARERKPDLGRLGFWRAVAAVKRRSDLIDRYADRIAAIDRESFTRRVRIRFPAAFGLIVDVAGAAVGVALIALPLSLPGPGQPGGQPAPLWWSAPWRELFVLTGMGALIGTTHTLAHWIVGTLVGIRFTDWFSVPPLKPQPGFKTDYASYLRTPARARAWMHASGAIVTKLVPFIVYPFALQAGLDPWAIWVILAVGVLQLVTDALYSVRASDWKKFRREMRAAS